MLPPRQKLLIIPEPGKAVFEERDLPLPGPRDVVIRPQLSTFKHGTEMMAYTGRSPFARRRFDTDLRLFDDRSEWDRFYPRPMGSMTAGLVEWVGAEANGLKPGQQVYAWAPIADVHIMEAEKVAPLGRLNSEQALCIDPASFALGAVIDGAIEASEIVLVTGLGAIGLFVVHYCVTQGAHVIAASRFKKRRDLAERFGAAEVYDPAAHDDLARLIKEKTRGADAAIECSGDLGTLHQAVRATKQCGRVVCVGFYDAGDQRLNLGEEFFHNRISLLASLPAMSWNNPTRGEPALYAKDLQNRAARDFEEKRFAPDGILDPILPFDEAERAVARIAKEPDTVVKAVLRH